MAPEWNRRFYLLFVSFPAETTSKAEREFLDQHVVAEGHLKALTIFFMGDSEKMTGSSLTTSE
jgi:hypothetical protein